MKTLSARKVAALVFALTMTGGSLAGAGGPKNYGEGAVGATVDAGPKNYGESVGGVTLNAGPKNYGE